MHCLTLQKNSGKFPKKDEKIQLLPLVIVPTPQVRVLQKRMTVCYLHVMESVLGDNMQ